MRHAAPSDVPPAAWPPGRELLYVIDARATLAGHGLLLELWSHDPNGTRTRARRSATGADPARALPHGAVPAEAARRGCQHQTQPVHAYRLIARDTIEEKILELQQTKRSLAAAIIGADNALFLTLSKEDLELLLA